MKHITHPFSSSVSTSLNGTIVSTEPVVSQVLIEELSNGHLVRHADIHLLLHQEKLAALGERVAAAYVDSMQPSSPSASSTEGLSDSQIISTIKSKYLQSPAELSSWMQHLQDIAISEISKVKEQNELTSTVDDPSAGDGTKNQ